MSAHIVLVTRLLESQNFLPRRARARWNQTLLSRYSLPLILLAAFKGAEAQTNLFPEFRLEAAREYLRGASQIVEQLIQTNAEALFINARLQSQLGDQPEAVRLALAALSHDTNRTDIHFFLADIFIRQDRLEDAATTLRQAIATDPQCRNAYSRLGMVLDRLGDFPDARAAFEFAVRLHPEDSTAHFLFGRMLLNQGHAQTAKTEFERACQLDPKSANARYGLFQAQTRLGDSAAAQQTLATFHELKSKEKSAMDAEDIRDEDEKDLRTYTAEFHVNIGRQLLRERQEVLAEANLRQAFRIDPVNVPAREMLAELLLHQGRLSEARPLYIELIKFRPQEVTYRLNLGTLLLQLKDPEGPDQLKHVLDLDPKQPQALHNLARFYLASGQQTAEALALCQRLVAIQPTASNYDLLGWAFYANARTKEALNASGQAVEKGPTNSVYRQRHDRLKRLVEPNH